MEWISVKDRLPEEGVPVLVCRLIMTSVKYQQEAVYIEEDWQDGIYFYGISNVTHWMPLPEPPDRKEG